MKRIKLLEVRSELGAGTRGAGMGIDALRVACLNKGSDYFRRFNSVVVPDLNHVLFEKTPLFPFAKHIDAIYTVQKGIASAVEQTLRFGEFPLVLAGASATWAEFFLAQGAKLIPVPDAVSDGLACQLIAMPLSAAMLLEDLQLQPGQWMVQNTANGAVGKTVAMLAQARGVKVVNLVRRDAGVAELDALGIANGVSTEQAGWEERVQAITGGEPIVRAVDSIGGDAANQIMNVVAAGATLVSFGAMSGQPLVLSANNLIFKQATVKGFWGAKRSEATPPAEMARLIGELIRLAASGELRLPVEASFDIADAARAAAASDVPGRAGKITLTA